MRYEPLPSSFFAGNREELASRLPAGSMLILHANDVFPTNADGTFALHQNANLFYLTGVDQEETVLVMTIREGGWDEILLLRETNEQIAIWEGVKALTDAHPDVDLYIGALDDHLNEHKYIVPGLGDAGDRIFGTK